MKREQRITFRRVQSSNNPPDPVPPEGEGWELRGCSAVIDAHGIVTYSWGWQRQVEDAEKVDPQVDPGFQEYLVQGGR